ncbi:hypothetical protein [Desulforamulus putei]|uniref:hypothetical protein n=1 Tax=Desulforamulus putei TaxID=74701 RepID=UPI002FDE9E2E
MFFRKITTRKNDKEYVYIKLIENYRANGKVKQRVVANFGSIENLSPGRINDLIISLKKLYKEIATQDHKNLDGSEITPQIPGLKDLLYKTRIIQELRNVVHRQQTCQIIEALIIKSMLASEMKMPVHEFCRQTGLAEANSIQFYNALRSLGEEPTRIPLIKARLPEISQGENIHKPVYIHMVSSVFQGHSYDVDMAGSIYSAQNYRKLFTLLLACDEESNPVDFEVVEDDNLMSEKMNLLINRLTGYLTGNIVVLDGKNCLDESSAPYPVAKQAREIPKEADLSLMSQGRAVYEGKIFFHTIRSEQKDEAEIKEIKANLAKVFAGLENIRADILLGKLNKETQVRKRADAVIKANHCQDLVAYQFNEAGQTFDYRVKEEALKEKTQSVAKTTWVLPGEKLKQGQMINNVKLKTDRFDVLTDQLNIPPINMFADYHYSPEIISGHVVLEIIKKQIAVAAKIPQQGGEIQIN